MEKKCTNLAEMAKGGPYSHAVEAGGLIFVSGAVPVNPRTGEEIRDDVEKGTALILDNIGEILTAAGSSLDKVARAAVYLTDMADFPLMNRAYATYFKENQPARTCVAVKALPAGFTVEIDVIALK